MAWEAPGFKIPGLVGSSSADLSTAQYRIVALERANEVRLATAADIPIGILQNKSTSELAAAEIMASGVSKLVVGSSWLANAPIGASSIGKGVTVGITSTTGLAYIVGIALEKSGPANSIGTIALNTLSVNTNGVSS